MPIRGAQFGRRISVEIVPPEGPGVLINGDASAPQLDVSVRVSKAMGGTPATCTVDVTNLTQRTRERAAGITRRIIDFSDLVGTIDGRLVFGEELDGGQAERVTRANGFGYLRVAAYYRGTSSTPHTIFEGTCKSVTPVPNTQPSPVTRITGGDGVIQDAAAICDKQWTEATSAATVLEYVIRDVMGTTLAGSQPGNFAAGLPAPIAALKLPAGYNATAIYATDILDTFVKQLSAKTPTDWWWDDGDVYWLERGKALPGKPILLDVTPSPGAFRLVDLPQAAEDGEVVATALMLPQMRPGRHARVVSGDFAGDYIVRAADHALTNGRGSALTTGRLARLGALPF